VDQDADCALRFAQDAGDLGGAHLVHEPEQNRATAIIGEGADGAQGGGGLVAQDGAALEVRGVGD
jgi:hypothetical protein